MTKPVRIICWLMGGGALALLYWWVLVPGIHTASLAEVRAHVAPELLQPLPHPDGGAERYEALRTALEPLVKRRPADPEVALKYQPVFRLDDPEVQQAMDVMNSGSLDRTGIAFEQQAPVHTLVAGLVAVAMQEAEEGHWPALVQQMDAAWLVLDRQAECDASIDDRTSTLSMQARLKRASLQLAQRPDLPIAVAEHLAMLNARNINDPGSIRRVLAGEMQYEQLKWIPDYWAKASGGERWVPSGTYDPLETAGLFSDMYLEAIRNAALPVSLWSHDALKDRPPAFPLSWEPEKNALQGAIRAAWMRIRMNTTANSLGRQTAAVVPVDYVLMRRVLQARTTQDQVAAALAVSRFRHAFGRDPGNFEELVTAGYLPALPRNHVKDEPREFDLQKLFEWPSRNAF